MRWTWVIAFLFLVACKKESAGPITPVEQGQKVYRAHCIACHSINPRNEGGLGPAIWGSSKELLEARVLRGVYPEGYTPKRDSKLMTTFPFLEKEIDALHAFLNN